MNAWRRYVRACRYTAGVGTRAHAIAAGVSPRTWQRRTLAEGWARPYEGVVIAPWVTDEDAATLAAVSAAHGGAAAGATARWRHGLGSRPRQLGIVIPHGSSVRCVRPDPAPPDAPPGDAPAERLRDHAEARRTASESRRWHQRCRRVEVVRCRWIGGADIELVAGVPLLTPMATAITLAATHPEDLRGFLIDAEQASKLDRAAVEDRLRRIGPVPGRHLVRLALDDLAGRRPESVFHDEVLTVFQQLGYHPTPHPVRVTSPGGRDLHPDIPLELWRIAIELDGDLHHRDRDARRRDRDRLSAYASTDWVPIIVDHRTWRMAREQVLAEVDAAIETQRARGIGRDAVPPSQRRAASS